MRLLRKYIWVFMIIGMIFVSLVVSLIFLIINKCISTKGKHRVLQLQKRSDAKIESNKYQERILDGQTPPLPPRTQFLTADVINLENLDDEHDYEQILDCQQSPGQQPDCVKVEEETKLMSPPSLCNHSNEQKRQSVPLGQSYENLAEDHDYEESTDLPDYVKVEEEPTILPPPPPLFFDDPSMKSDGFLGESYENLAEEHDYEESTDLPDYMKVEEEPTALPPPPPLFFDDPSMKSDGILGESYENLAEDHNYKESTDQQPDYVTADDEAEILLSPPPFSNDPNVKSCDLLSQSYENLAEEHDYEESTDQQPDYVTAESEGADPAADDTSEDYDDIGSENEDDYDDVA